MSASHRKIFGIITMLLVSAVVLYGWTSSGSRNHISPQLSDSLRFLIGRQLFFEKRLSITGTKSCGSCHNPQLAFTDGYRTSPGALADLHFRNTPTLINVSRQKYLNWANPDVTTLANQLEVPLFGTNPLEMGLSRADTTVLHTLSNDPRYKYYLSRLLDNPTTVLTWELVKDFISAYLQELNSYSSPYDEYKAGKKNAISESAKRGEQLFFSAQYGCGSCHKPPLFGADSTMTALEQYANIGLYNHNNGGYPSIDQGLFNVTGRPTDKGKFKIPTLRNLQYTAPYFHDGSAADLNEVLSVVEQAGRNITYGPMKGDGRTNPFKSSLIQPIPMSARDKQNLLDFLYSLNDTTILLKERFQIPDEEISYVF